MDLAQQAALISGASFWTTAAVADVPPVLMADGPHGLRKEVDDGTPQVGFGPSIPATCFPPAVGLSQSWSPELVATVGSALGAEAQAAGVGVLLGPGINIKRDPRGGRNFEYYSEDPHLTGVLGAAWVDGVQGQGVGASLKHFAANNAEHDRMRSSSDVDPRTLREVYLRAFENVVTHARPWTVMCSYNRINGVPAAENHWLLTEVLRDEWGFDGTVVSDWGAVGDRIAALRAGLDLEMPGGRDPAELVAAVHAGVLGPAFVERSAGRVADLARRVAAARRPGAGFDPDAHHRLAREVAGQCAVLLKNDGGLLPLAPGTPVAVLGEFAAAPRYQGGGSSNVNPTRVDVPLDELRAGETSYSPGFTTDGTGDAAALRAAAVECAAGADTAVVFLGLAAGQESEGFDREHIELPTEQLELLSAVLAVQPRTVVVLSHGGVLRLDAVTAAPAVVDAALLGQAAGGAVADVLYGVVNPSGRLAETVPLRIQDTPAYLSFPGEHSHVLYGEGLFVGHRWYDSREMAVAFPFGHGLSYTTFAYDGLRLAADGSGITAAVTVTNTGSRAGREVVQFYRGLPGSRVARAPRELTGFAAVTLDPGESAEVEVLLRRADLAYWDIRVDRWVVEGGEYEISVGASSRDLRARGTVAVDGDEVRVPITADSTLGEVMADPRAAAALGRLAARFGDGGAALGTDLARMIEDVPLSRIGVLAGLGPSLDVLGELLAEEGSAGGPPPVPHPGE